MRYYLGPWQQDAQGAWNPPTGVVGLVDLRATVACGTPGVALFASPDPLPSGYDLLGEGHIASLMPAGMAAAAWTHATGVVPPTGSLLDWLEYTLTEAADPSGETCPPPLMPTTALNLDIHLGGHSLVRRRSFDLSAPHARPVLECLRREYAEHRREAMAGRVRGPQGIDREHHRRLLDRWCRKFHVSDPDVFIPRGLPRETRLQHATTYTESFNQADSTTVGPDLTWTEVTGAWQTTSNQLDCRAVASDTHIRAEHDLSGDDNTAEITIISLGGGSSFAFGGSMARYQSGANTGYAGWLYIAGTGVWLSKIVAGARTNLAGPSSVSVTYPHTLLTTCDGSTISVDFDGVNKHSITDTAITTGLRGGVFGGNDLPGGLFFDSFTMADIGGGGGGVTALYYYHQQAAVA